MHYFGQIKLEKKCVQFAKGVYDRIEQRRVSMTPMEEDRFMKVVWSLLGLGALGLGLWVFDPLTVIAGLLWYAIFVRES